LSRSSNTDAVRGSPDSLANLLLATLSGGMVGLSDSLGVLRRGGAEVRADLRHVVRGDGVLVKPDAPIVPIDAVYQADAGGGDGPMVAATDTDHGAGLKSAYVFAYSRPRLDRPATVSLSAAQVGFSGEGRVYVYDGVTGRGSVQAARTPIRLVLHRGPPYHGAYITIVPVGASGIAFLGDTGLFASLGRQRIPALSDDGHATHATIRFAPEEGPIDLAFYARSAPAVRATAGTAGRLDYDATSHLYQVPITPARSTSR